ncbi:hypothetical protein [Egicoccus sp. AB-alg2]|uniref:hypothetical protein n=1 Tax=Egicoccus sp. AB-alg2 TaxID=3242693 RepID=UPI00359E651D
MIRRLLWIGLLATLAAGLVGAARQRREVVHPGSATRPPTSPPPRQGPLGRRLSAWVPAPPRTRLGRVAAFVWASPLTAVGLLVALVSGGRPRWQPQYGCFVTEGVRGPSAAALRIVGAQANAIGHVVLSREGTSAPALLAHEAVHVRQAERLGPLLFPLYLWLSARYGYRHHPIEQAARLGARRATGPGSGG